MRDLVLRLLQAAEAYNIEQKDLRCLCLKVLIMSLKYVDRKQIFESLFPGDFVDWERTQQSLGDAATWLSLLSLMHWNTLPETMQVRDQLLEETKAALKACNLDCSGWDVACKVLLLQLIHCLQSVHAIELFTSRILKRSTREGTMMFLANMYDKKHLPETYTKTLSYILGSVNMDVDLLNQTMSIIAKQREERTLNMRLKSIQLVALRPRLRDKMKTSVQLRELADSRLGTWDSYKGFCHVHRFPNNMSDRIKRLLYFLSSQVAWDWTTHVKRLVQHADIAEGVIQRPVSNPNCDDLMGVIKTLSMDGSRPFPEMMAFKAKGFGSFPVVYVQSMTLTQVLQLYTIAYQPSWKEMWKSHIGILSPQITKDVETFVLERPFNGECVMNLLCGC